LENLDQFEDDFDKCFDTLHKIVSESFMIMENDPEKRDEVMNLWKNHILKFVSFTHKESEEHHNKDVFKAISKALMFGR
jgi:hypothetical protein